MSSSVRLLLLTDAVGGVWVYSLELARALAEHNVEVILAVLGPSPSEAQREQAAGIRMIDTGLPLDWMPTSLSDMRRAGAAVAAIARREDVDLVQTCSASLLAETDFKMPTIAVQHSCVASWWAAVRGTSLPAEFVWLRDLVEAGLRNADAIVAPSGAFAAETARIYGLRRPVVPVHNGRHLAAMTAVPQSHSVVTASRLWDEGKNVATLDGAAALLKVPFEAAGPLHGPNGAVAEFRNLRLLGEVSDTRLAGLLAARPVYASAALYEPFGLSVLEAAAAGCALVLSDISTFRELWGDCAIFVAATDASGFANACRQLLDDPAERARLGAAAADRAQLYTPGRMARNMLALYEKLLGAAALPEPMQLAGAAA